MTHSKCRDFWKCLLMCYVSTMPYVCIGKYHDINYSGNFQCEIVLIGYNNWAVRNSIEKKSIFHEFDSMQCYLWVLLWMANSPIELIQIWIDNNWNSVIYCERTCSLYMCTVCYLSRALNMTMPLFDWIDTNS